ncbi:uncharacterized protein PG986_014690 [Apiospora aurea]|uniref:Uncharacterized protein n=1 Tax=Apiospora aurea TaxID=335848 RepID=A0ABR1PTQ1_9PEZI
MDANGDANAEYETEPEYIAAAPVDAAEPLSVYDAIPDEYGGTVIPNSPMKQTSQPATQEGSGVFTTCCFLTMTFATPYIVVLRHQGRGEFALGHMSHLG